MLRDKAENQNYGKIQKCRGEILSKRLKTTTRTSETQGEFANMPKSQQDDIKDVGGFVGGKVKNGKRQSGSIENRILLTLDARLCDSDFAIIFQCFTTLHIAFIQRINTVPKTEISFGDTSVKTLYA